MFLILFGLIAIVFTNWLGNSPTDFIVKVNEIYPPTKNSNMSSLVYLQGWQDAYANFISSHGIGLGFNMMGCDPLPKTEARLILKEYFNADKLNSQDGSFLLSKGISEFGVFFIIFIGYSLHTLKQTYKVSSSFTNQTVRRVYSIWGIIIFSALFTMSVRSSSYFTGNFPLLVFALFAPRNSHTLAFKSLKNISK